MGTVVLKFGGTSVSTRERWESIAAQIAVIRDQGHTPVVVCSATSGTSNALSQLVDDAAVGRDTSELVSSITVRHLAFAEELGVMAGCIEPDLDRLRQLATGMSLLAEASDRTRAKVMALGEILSTKLGAAFLNKHADPIVWVDIREHLVAPATDLGTRRWLSAAVPFDADPAMSQAFSGPGVLTQGFIASDPEGDTVLLGRGGSDTSAAIIAARIGAVRCEIWTDVPGMFTADPRHVPAARLLRTLGYDEALEIATTGAKVLHPRAIAPVQKAQIPLHIRCTPHPDMPSTVVAPPIAQAAGEVKAISSRSGLVLVSMETVGMWQEVGFLANAFACFKELGLSVDTVSTSETSVTVTLDPAANALGNDPGGRQRVLSQLEQRLKLLCTPRFVQPVASVSLVGRGIRAILHRLAPVLELFEEHRIHLVSQAANDLNLTVVVDEAQAQPLMGRLHALLFGHRSSDQLFGPSWTELQAGPEPSQAPSAPVWWRTRAAELRQPRETPCYVYDEPTLRARAQELRDLEHVDRVLFAMKANPFPPILDLFVELGLGLECVSEGEWKKAKHHGAQELLFTPNFASRAEVAAALEAGVQVTLDSLYPLEAWPELFAGTEIFLRLDPGKGRGHHAKVRTAGSASKFGIDPAQLEHVAELARNASARVVGLHAHAGSGVLEATAWQDTGRFLLQAAERFPDVRVLDLGGGLGVPSKAGGERLDLAALNAALAPLKEAAPHLQLWLEPGRYLVAEAGVLLTTVTQQKQKATTHYIGVDAGMHTLLRPALYGAWHEAVNLTRLSEPLAHAITLVGPICESGDVLARDRRFPETREGDLVLIGNAGAYGASMASSYNSRALPHEELLS